MSEHFILPIFCIIFSVILVYGPKLYITTNQIVYLIVTIITTNILIYVIYRMIFLKYSLLITAVCGKILPTVVLAVIGFVTVKDEKVTFQKIFAIALVIIGSFMLS